MNKEIYPNELSDLLSYLNNKDWYVEDYGYKYKRISLDDTQMLLLYIKHLEDKNKEIKNYYMDIVKIADRRLDKYIEYYSRCMKAIDYIENHIIATETEDVLLNILQNGSEDNEYE